MHNGFYAKRGNAHLQRQSWVSANAGMKKIELNLDLRTCPKTITSGSQLGADGVQEPQHTGKGEDSEHRPTPNHPPRSRFLDRFLGS